MLGEIYKLPGTVIEPDVASGLGKRLLSNCDGYVEGQAWPALRTAHLISTKGIHDATQRIGSTNYIEFSAEDYEVMRATRDTFESLLDDEAYHIATDIHIGTYPRWHIDGVTHDVRLLVNLSETTLELRIASEWGEHDYVRPSGHMSIDDAPEPREAYSLFYGPGEGVLADNRCPLDEQTPHVGVPVDNKVYLRFLATKVHELV